MKFWKSILVNVADFYVISFDESVNSIAQTNQIV